MQILEVLAQRKFIQSGWHPACAAQDSQESSCQITNFKLL